MMKYFFASDVHLGLSSHRDNAERELLFEQWLKMVEEELLQYSRESSALFLLGDIFDFWFEYRNVAPKGFLGVLSQLKAMCSKGVRVIYLKGNHDCWRRGYFEDLGMEVVNEPFYECVLGGKKFLLSHGDYPVSRYSLKSKITYSVFNSKTAYWLFTTLVHPDLIGKLGNGWSSKSRKSKFIAHKFQKENELAVKYIRERELKGEKSDYYIFGHLHSSVKYPIDDENSRYLFVLGHWIEGDIFYGVFDERGFRLVEFELK